MTDTQANTHATNAAGPSAASLSAPALPGPHGPIPSDPDVLFAWQRRHDRRGDVIHTWIASGFCVLLAAPVTTMESAFLVLLLWWLLRVPWMWPLTRRLGEQATCRVLLLWVAWVLVAVAWSPDRRMAWDHAGDLRWVLAVPLLWPAIDRRRVLIAAMCVGFLLANLVQALQAAGVLEGKSALVWSRDADRVSAWWQPVVGGSILTAALGLHLGAALLGRGRARVLGMAGAAVSAAGVIATGTRGAWIAAAALVVASVAFALARIARDRSARLVLASLAGLVIAAGAAWLALGGAIERRFEKGVQEVRAAVREGDYQSDTGKRIRMAIMAAEAFRQHPIRGVGTGGYRAWSEEQLRARGVDMTTVDIRDHAHSSPLHIAATGGLIGLALAGTLIGLVIASEGRRLWRMPAPGYDAGPMLALVGLVLAGMFDSVHINAQTSALLFALVAMCLPVRPREVEAEWWYRSAGS